MKISRFVIGACMLFTSSAQATLVGAINALDPGDKYRVLFVTSTTTSGSSANISTYNTVAQNAAATGSVTAGLGLSWKALASTPTITALTNTGLSNTDTTPLSIFNTAGELLATSSKDLFDGSIIVSVRYDENAVSTNTKVWTGTLFNGTTLPGTELGNSSGTATAGTGDSLLVVTDFWWIQHTEPAQDQLFPIYAMSSEGVKGVIPIPAALPLFGSFLGLMGLIAWKRKNDSAA